MDEYESYFKILFCCIEDGMLFNWVNKLLLLLLLLLVPDDSADVDDDDDDDIGWWLLLSDVDVVSGGVIDDDETLIEFVDKEFCIKYFPVFFSRSRANFTEYGSANFGLNS